jgi:DNA-binding SARP family transcriptional activator
MPIDFRILGPLEARVDGRALPLGSPKQRALLGLLLVHANETVSRDRLLDELWAETAPATVDSALHVYLSRLRRMLESAGAGGALERDTYGYKLYVGPEQLDEYRFENLVGEGSEALTAGEAALAADRLRKALALWTGPALADLQSERFAIAAAARLDERRLFALEQRLEADLALGRHLDLIGELEALAAQYPLQERLSGQLMLALYRSERQAEALQVYQATRRELAEQLGMEPGTALQRLERAILTHDPSLELLPPPDGRPGSAPSRRSFAIAAAVALGAVALGVLLFTRGGSDDGPSPPNTVGVIDPDRNKLTARIAVGLLPSAIATGAGRAWVVNQGDDTLSVVDFRSDEVVRTIALSAGRHVAGSGVAFGHGGAWVANAYAAGTVTEVWASDGPRPPIRVEPLDTSDVLLVAVAGRGVWLASTRHATLYELDPLTGRTIVQRALPPAPIGLAVGDRALWTLSIRPKRRAALLARIDLTSGRSATEIRLPFPATALAVGYGSIWVTVNSQDTVLRVDPRSGTVERTIRVGAGPTAIATGSGAVWVANAKGKTISRIDPKRNDVVAAIPVAFTPGAIVCGGGKVWVTNI